MDDWTVAARQNHPKLATVEMHGEKVAVVLSQLKTAFKKEVTNEGLTQLRKLLQFYSINPAIWRGRIRVVQLLFDYFETGNGACRTGKRFFR